MPFLLGGRGGGGGWLEERLQLQHELSPGHQCDMHIFFRKFWLPRIKYG